MYALFCKESATMRVPSISTTFHSPESSVHAPDLLPEQPAITAAAKTAKMILYITLFFLKHAKILNFPTFS